MLSCSRNKQLSVIIFFFCNKFLFLTIVTHLIYRILTLLGTIVCNKILFKFKDNKKQTLFKKTNKLCFKKNKL